MVIGQKTTNAHEYGKDLRKRNSKVRGSNVVTMRVPEKLMLEIERKVLSGHFVNRSELIRTYIREGLKRDAK